MRYMTHLGHYPPLLFHLKKVTVTFIIAYFC